MLIFHRTKMPAFQRAFFMFLGSVGFTHIPQAQAWLAGKALRTKTCEVRRDFPPLRNENAPYGAFELLAGQNGPFY